MKMSGKLKMKKLKTLIALAVTFGIGTNVVAARDAHALMLTPLGDGLAHADDALPLFALALSVGAGCASGGPVLLGCLTGFAIFVLNEKVGAFPPLTRQDLLDNGYSSAEADTILSDAARLNERLKKEKRIISLHHGDSEERIREGLVEFMRPEVVSDEFLNEFAKRLYLIAQEERGPEASVNGSMVKPQSENSTFTPDNNPAAARSESAR